MTDKKETFWKNMREELEFLQDLVLDITGMSELEVDEFWGKHLKKRIRSPCHDETLLIAFCLKHQRKIPVLADYPFIIKYQYEFVLGHSQHGEGDLLLKDENKRYLVVEAKYIDLTKSGRNQGNKRTKKRKDVKRQVRDSLQNLRKEKPDAEAQGFVLTNETIPPELSEKFEEYRKQKNLSWKI